MWVCVGLRPRVLSYRLLSVVRNYCRYLLQMRPGLMNCYLCGFIEQKWVDKEKYVLLNISHAYHLYFKSSVWGVAQD